MGNIINYHNTATKLLERSKRQLKLAQLLDENPELGYAELARIMRSDPWVAERWPDYSPATAYGDFKASLAFVKDEIEKVSGAFFARQLGMIEGVISVLMKIVTDEEADPDTIIRAAAAINPYLDKEIRMFGNYANTKIDVNKRVLRISLEDFHAAREKMDEWRGKLMDGVEEPDEDVIDGEIIAS